MPMNNPSGVNSWEGFGTEEPYGQQTQDARLAKAAPLAGGEIAAGPIRAAKTAERQTQQTPEGPPQIPEQPPTLNPAATQATADAATWQQLAAHPDASPLVQMYAAQA